MTTAVVNNGTMVVGGRPRPSLEELVDRVMDALFASNHEESRPQTVARSVHDARRLRRAGNLDGALALMADLDTATADTRETRWTFAEWLSLVRRAYGDREVLVYSQGTGRAGQASVQAQPAGTSAPGRWVMVVANSAGGPGGSQKPPSPGRCGGGVGRAVEGKGQSPPGRLSLPPGVRRQLYGVRRY